jgi:hypothetical protein
VSVPYFLLFLCFRKATREIFSEFKETKAKVPIFPDTRRSPKQRRRGTTGQPHHRVARPDPGPCHQWWGHLAHLLTPPFRLYILLGEENPKTQSIFYETYCKPLPSLTRDWEGLQALPSTLPERGITAGGLLHHHACLRSNV